MTKECKTCREVKSLSEFYKHPTCPTGLGSCKQCRIKYVSKWYRKTKPLRRQYRKEYRVLNLAKDKAWKLRASKVYAKRHPEKVAAHAAVSTAIKSGVLKRKPCEVCGQKKSHAHHSDYSKPLKVQWLCHIHHLEIHTHQEST